MTAPAEKPRGAPRADWIDVAKGGAIVLVVLLHTTNSVIEKHVAVGSLRSVNDALATVRMPVFFVLSGLFAYRSLEVPWRRFTRDKVAKFLWLYTLWSTVLIVVTAMTSLLRGEPWLGQTLTEIRRAALVSESLWYIVALPMYFVAARTLYKVSSWVQLIIAAAVSCFAALHLVRTGSWGVDHTAQYWVWFVVGTHFSHMIIAFVSRATFWKFLAFLIVAGSAGALAKTTLPSGSGVGSLLVPIVAVPCALVAAHVLCEIEVAKVALSRLGRRTLPVYVLHPSIIVALGPAIAAVASRSPALIILSAAVVGTLCIAAWLNLRNVACLWDLPLETWRKPKTDGSSLRPR